MSNLWKCLICGADFAHQISRSLVCEPCWRRVLDFPSQSLTIQERLWGKCYERDQHWEYSSQTLEGRPAKLRYERGQVPAAQLALVLSGRPRPSERHMARVHCGSRACVRPDHLEWMEWIGGRGESWLGGLDANTARELLTHQRTQHAQYQRAYRRRIKELGTPTVRDSVEQRRAQDRQRDGAEIAALRARHTVAPVPMPAAPEIEPLAVAGELETSLLGSIRAAKIAPVD